MRMLLDSNVWIDARKGLPEAVQVLEEATRAEWAGYSAITRLEVFGFPNLTKEDAAAFEILLGEFVEEPVTSEVITEAIAFRQRHQMKSPDAIIAATA